MYLTLQDVKRGYHIINKSGGAIKYLNKRPKEECWYGRLFTWLDGDVPKGIETSMWFAGHWATCTRTTYIHKRSWSFIIMFFTRCDNKGTQHGCF